MEENETDVQERIKSLAGIKCHGCLDSGYLHEWINGQWHIKYEKTGEVTEGKPPIRLMKCDHGVDRGY